MDVFFSFSISIPKLAYAQLIFSTDSSLDCSLENDESNEFLLQQTSNLTPVQNNRAASNNNLDKPFGMDLSVEFGGHSNRSSIISQVIIIKD